MSSPNLGPQNWLKSRHKCSQKYGPDSSVRGQGLAFHDRCNRAAIWDYVGDFQENMLLVYRLTRKDIGRDGHVEF